MASPQDPWVRFWSKVDQRTDDGCWNWKGGVARGYGLFHFRKPRMQTIVAHMFAFLTSGGQISDGFVLDHLCKNTLCVRPDHLEVVTQRENIYRSRNHVAGFMRQTKCKNGHPLSGGNLYVDPNGSRICRICNNKRCKAYQKREKEKLQCQTNLN